MQFRVKLQRFKAYTVVISPLSALQPRWRQIKPSKIWDLTLFTNKTTSEKKKIRKGQGHLHYEQFNFI